jgi:hypothetical protein
LRGFPAAVRPSLPVLCRTDTEIRPVCLALAGNGAHIDLEGADLRVLTAERFAAAAGLASKEAEIGTIAHMAKVPPGS